MGIVMTHLMTRILSASEVAKLLSLEEVLDVLSQAHVAFSSGETVQPTRLQLPVSIHNGRLLIMPSYIQPIEALAVKIVGGFHDNTKRGFPAAYGILILHDAETGAILSVMDGAYLTGLRTAATAVLATRTLANPDPQVLCILGGGYIGRMTTRCAVAVMDFKRVCVYSRTGSTAESFKDELASQIPTPIEIAPTPEAACRDADVIVTATASKEPVLHFDWLKPGVHINALGSSLPDHREIDAKTMSHALVIVESIEATMAEAGDILIPLETGEIKKTIIHAELGEVISGDKRGRRDETEITLFKSVGIAIQDAATAQLAYQKAQMLGIGTDVHLT